MKPMTKKEITNNLNPETFLNSNLNRCLSCEVVMINGIRCHEHGCPEANPGGNKI